MTQRTPATQGPPKLTTARTISQSEKDANKLLDAVARLETKYPTLKELSSSFIAVRPRYKASLKSVSPEQLDRRGSLIGGAPFLSKEYPVPKKTAAAPAGNKKVPMAPLLQLDLEEVSKIADEDLGDGLLQLWMRCGQWGTANDGDSEIRIIPRKDVTKTKTLLDLPERSANADLDAKLAEIAPLNKRTPKKYTDALETIRFEHHWDGGLEGFDWTLSVFAEEIDSFKPDESAASLQIVGWEPDGFTIPLDWEFWYVDREYRHKYPDGLEDETDFKTIEEITSRHGFHAPLCSLFELDPQFSNTVIFVLDKPPIDRSRLWRPLIAFAGPLSGAGFVQDQHMLFYRRKTSRFEFLHECYRWH